MYTRCMSQRRRRHRDEENDPDATWVEDNTDDDDDDDEELVAATSPTTTPSPNRGRLQLSPIERRFPRRGTWLHGLVIPPAAPYPIETWSKSEMHPLEKDAFPDVLNSKNKNKTPEKYVALRNWIIDYAREHPNEFVGQLKMKDLVKARFPGQGAQAIQIYGFLLVLGAVQFTQNSMWKAELMNDAKRSLLQLQSEATVTTQTPAPTNEKKRKRDTDDAPTEIHENAPAPFSPPHPKRLKDVRDQVKECKERLEALNALLSQGCTSIECDNVGTVQCWMCDHMFCSACYNDRHGWVAVHIRTHHYH